MADALGGRHHLGVAVDVRHLGALGEGDAGVGPQLGPAEVEILRVAPREVARERHPVVRRTRLVAEHRDVETARVVARPHRLDETVGHHAGADDDDAFAGSGLLDLLAHESSCVVALEPREAVFRVTGGFVSGMQHLPHRGLLSGREPAPAAPRR